MADIKRREKKLNTISCVLVVETEDVFAKNRLNRSRPDAIRINVEEMRVEDHTAMMRRARCIALKSIRTGDYPGYSARRKKRLVAVAKIEKQKPVQHTCHTCTYRLFGLNTSPCSDCDEKYSNWR
jgi:hypothetical protein